MINLINQNQSKKFHILNNFQKICKILGVKYCVSVNSGTDALLFALSQVGLKKNDEVIVTNFTIISCISSIIRAGAKPNNAHFLLAKLEEKGLIEGVITQNVDGLHLEAGSSNVNELHGSIRTASCLECGQFFQMNDVINRVKQGENPPICKEFEGQSCNGLIKPTAVFFGEGLPKSPWDSAVDKSKDTSLMIVIGSSLQVSPANSLPDVALRTGSELVIIDLMDTPFDSRATLKITDRAVHVATLLEESLGL